MNPNQPGPQQPYNNYLDQIAPVQVKTSFMQSLRPIHLILAGVVLIVLIMLIVSIVNSVTSAPSKTIEKLAARLQTTATIADSATTVLKTSELRSVNSNLKIYLTNTNRDIAQPFTKVGVNVEKISKKTAAAEAGTDIVTRLEDARLNAVYDRTYAREMSYQLDTILTLMKQAYGSVNSRSVKEVLSASYENLAPIQEQFAAFNAANEN